MNESKSRTRTSSKEPKSTVTFGAALSFSEERKLFQAQTYFDMSLKNLSSPFPQQDLISADSSAEDIFAVNLPTHIVEIRGQYWKVLRPLMQSMLPALKLRNLRPNVQRSILKRSPNSAKRKRFKQIKGWSELWHKHWHKRWHNFSHLNQDPRQLSRYHRPHFHLLM